MRCPACEQINNDHSRFCSECGASLAPVVWSPPEVIDPQQPQASARPASRMVMATPATSAAQPFRPAEYAPPVPAVQPGQAYGTYGYVPHAAPLINNNVTVTQAPPYAAPPPAPSVQAVVMATRRPSTLLIFLATLVLTGLGIFAGILWFEASSSDSAGGIVALVTLVILIANFLILERLARH